MDPPWTLVLLARHGRLREEIRYRRLQLRYLSATTDRVARRDCCVATYHTGAFFRDIVVDQP